MNPANGAPYTGKTAVVVGTGLAGASTACCLAKQGFAVKVFEMRDDARKKSRGQQLSYSVVIRRRAAEALTHIGVDLPKPGEGFKSRMHNLYGSYAWTDEGRSPSFTLDPNTTFIATRDDAFLSILDAAEKYPSVSFNFNHKCKGVLFDEKQVILEDERGREVQVGYDLLIGADGNQSQVRMALKEHDKTFKAELFDDINSLFIMPEFGYLPSEEESEAAMTPGYLYSVRKSNKDFGAIYKGISLMSRSPRGGFIGATRIPTRLVSEIEGSEKDWLNSILPDDFPKRWRTRIDEALEKPKFFRLKIVFANRFHGKRTILIGDAAHGTHTAIGYGANLAIEDGPAVEKALIEAQGDLDKLPGLFTKMRYRYVMDHINTQAVLCPERPMPRLRGLVFRTVAALFTLSKIIRKRVFRRETALNLRTAITGEISAEEAMRIIKRDVLLTFATIVGIVVYVASFIARRLKIPVA